MKPILILLLLIFSAQDAFAACGTNHGWLPWTTRSGIDKPFTQTNHCGTTRGAVGQSPSGTWASCDATGGSAGWQPKRNTICKGTSFTEVCSRWNKSRLVYGTSSGGSWSPGASTICDGEQFTQTSSCGVTRTATGSKDCCNSSSWSPSRGSVCDQVEFTQTNGCGTTRTRTGTKDCSSSTDFGGTGNDRKPDGWAWLTTPEDDEGYFQDGGINVNETILYNDNRNTIIRRYRSAAGHPYRLWIDDNEPGGFGVNLKDRASFDVWLNYMDELNGAGDDIHPNKHWCELVEDVWTPWAPTGAVPTTCGTHNVTDTRTCGVQGATNPCPFTCPNGTQNQTETRNRTIDNGACCVAGPWTPATNTECLGDSFTQSNGCATRPATGSQDCSVCTDTTWTPAPSTQCAGSSFTQTSNCGNPRGNIGTGGPCGGGGGGGGALKWEFVAAPVVSTTPPGSIPVIPGGRSCLSLGFGWPPLLGLACAVAGQTDFCYQADLGMVPIGCNPGTPGCTASNPVTVNRNDYRCQ